MTGWAVSARGPAGSRSWRVAPCGAAVPRLGVASTTPVAGPCYPLLVARKVKGNAGDAAPRAGRTRARRAGVTRLSSKNQVTLPVAALRAAGLGPGDDIRIERVEPGRIVLAREQNPLTPFFGMFHGVYPEGDLEQLRAEWD